MAVNIPFPLPATGFALNSKVRVNLDFLVAQFNEFNSGTATWDQVAIGTPNDLTGTLTFYNEFNANYLTFQPGATGANLTFTLPIAYPSGEGLLKSSGAGVMSFAAGTGLIYEASSTIAFTGAAGQARSLVMIGTDGTPVLADHGYDIDAADNGLLYIPSGSAVEALVNSTGTTAILRGSSTGTPAFAELLGTSNQITVTHNASDTTLSTPQDIGTSSNLIFNRVRVAAGSNTSPGFHFESSTANIVGLYAETNGTGLNVRVGSSPVFGVDSTGLGTFTGEVRAPLVRATTSFKISTGASSIITLQTDGTAFGDYTLTLPTNDGGANEVLSTDGSGNLSWVAVSGVGAANQALSNLASVAINTTLASDTTNTDDIGTTLIRWKTGFFATSIDISATSSQIVLGTTRTVTFTAPTPASASRTVTFPDLSGDYSVVGTAGTQSIAGDKTFTSAVTVPDGTAGAPGLRLTSENIGLYRFGANAIGVSTNGLLVYRFGAGTSAAATDQEMIINAGPIGTSTTYRNRATDAVGSGSATKIATINQFCNLVFVAGTDGSNVFGDLVFTAFAIATPVVIASRSSGASSRTYTQSSDELRLQMGSGTYDVSTYQIEQRSATF